MSGKNIFKKIRNYLDKTAKAPKFLQNEIYLLTINEKMLFCNDTILKIVWRHGRKEK